MLAGPVAVRTLSQLRFVQSTGRFRTACQRHAHRVFITDSPVSARWADDVTKLQPSKSPVLAAVLNLIPLPLPLGYSYLDRWGRFRRAIGLRVSAVVFSFIIYINAFFLVHRTSAEEIWYSFLTLLPLAAVLAGSAIDAYRVAERHNASVE